jgi:bacterial/archaeal transporter family protein
MTWIFYSSAAAFCAALVVVLSKAGIQKVDPILVFGVESVCMLFVTWSFIFAKRLHHQVFSIDKKIWIFILTAGVLTTFSSLLSFHSLKIGHASRTASLEKISLVITAILAILFLKEHFNWRLAVGIILMAAGVLFIAFSENPQT